MAWFAAHAIMYFKLKSGVQDRFTIWENVYLIEAENSDQAWEKAEAWAKQKEGNGDGWGWLHRVCMNLRELVPMGRAPFRGVWRE